MNKRECERVRESVCVRERERQRERDRERDRDSHIISACIEIDE